MSSREKKNIVRPRVLFWMGRACAVSLALLPATLFAASAAITEIMYDLAGTDAEREWIEVKNTGTEPVFFSDWKFFEAETNHGLSLFRGSATTTAGGFAVIADNPDSFLADRPDFSGTLFKSSFSLSNSGETIALKLDGVTVDEAAYVSSLGAAGDGKSLQKNGNILVPGIPTPGGPFASDIGGPPAVGSSTEDTAVSSNGDNADAAAVSSVSSVPLPANRASSGGSGTLEPRIFTEVEAPLRGLAGVDVRFTARVAGLKKEPITNARVVWSFGDGGSAEGYRVSHVYHYPGNYVVLADAVSGEWSGAARVDVAISAPALSVSRAEAGGNGFIEIENAGADDADLSRWFLRSGDNFFTFPNGTILSAGEKVRFPAAVTKLASDPLHTSLLFPNGTVAARYEPLPAGAAPASVSAVPAASVSAPDAAATDSVVAGAPAEEPADDKDAAEPAPPLLSFSPQARQEMEAAPREAVVNSLSLSGESPRESLAAAGAGVSGVSVLPWIIAAAALSVFGVAGFTLASRKASRPGTGAEEYEIVE